MTITFPPPQKGQIAMPKMDKPIVSQPTPKGEETAQKKVSLSVYQPPELSADVLEAAEAQDYSGLVAEVTQFLLDYMIMPKSAALVITAWVMAAWLVHRNKEIFDRFPHLCVTSPDKRCGKSRLLEVLQQIVPEPHSSVSISPAALYRVIEEMRPTFLLDEQGGLIRRGSETAELFRELLNGGISKGATVTRCTGPNREKTKRYSIYAPKVFALIDRPDGVTADRCLLIGLVKKTEEETVKRFLTREVEPVGRALQEKLAGWAISNHDRAAKLYGEVEPFKIDNDRMAELLMPLQAVLLAAAGAEELAQLEEWAQGISERDQEQEAQSTGVRLLDCCRALFRQHKADFLSTAFLLDELRKMPEEAWGRYHQGRPLSDEALAKQLRKYSIVPGKNRQEGVEVRGYFRAAFKDAWTRFVPPGATATLGPADKSFNECLRDLARK
jgi:hypothetical protein